MTSEQVAALLATHDYKHVVAHVPASTFTFLRDLLPEHVVHTAHGRPAGIEDCNRMRDALRNIRDTDKQPSGPEVWRARKLADLGALASFQFGHEAAADLVADGVAHGKVPYVKLDGPPVLRMGKSWICTCLTPREAMAAAPRSVSDR